jgi:hypothetical protein
MSKRERHTHYSANLIILETTSKMEELVKVVHLVLTYIHIAYFRFNTHIFSLNQDQGGTYLFPESGSGKRFQGLAIHAIDSSHRKTPYWVILVKIEKNLKKLPFFRSPFIQGG